MRHAVSRPRFVEIGRTAFGTTWINPEHITGFTVQRITDPKRPRDEGATVYQAAFLVEQSVYHLMDHNGRTALWPTFAEAKAALDAFLHQAAAAPAHPGLEPAEWSDDGPTVP